MTVEPGEVTRQPVPEEDEEVWTASYKQTVKPERGKEYTYFESYAIYRLEWDQDIKQ